MVAVVLGDSPIRLWGLTPAERIERQLRAEGIRVWREDLAALPPNAHVPRAARRLPLRRPRDPRPRQDPAGDAGSGRRRRNRCRVAAHVRAEQAEAVAQALIEGLARPPPAGHRHGDARRDRARATKQGSRSSIGLSSCRSPPSGAPRSRSSRFPARTRASPISSPSGCGPFPRSGSRGWCVRIGMTPNQVTAASLVLVIVAGVLFARGEFALGSRRRLDHDVSRHRRRQARARDDHVDQARQRVRPRHRPHPSSVLVPRVGHGPGARAGGDRRHSAVVDLLRRSSAAMSAAASAKARSSSSSRASRSSRGVRSIRGSG